MPPLVAAVLRGSGEPLDNATREDMERRFGFDFTRVRVHTGATAASNDPAEREADAAAERVASGRDIAAGELQPGMIQRAPLEEAEGPEAEAAPSAEELAAERAASEALEDRIYEKYWDIAGKIAAAQVLNRTDRRQEWIDTLASKAAPMLEAILAKEGPLSMWEVVPLHDLLTRIEGEVDAEDDAAYALWERINERYAEERARLVDKGDYESELALRYLDQAFDERERRIAAIIDTGALVREDVLGLAHVLDSRAHVETARIVARREFEEAEAQLAELSEVREERPGFLETAWEIVGCSSLGECVADVGLTVVTAGTGKALKFVVKGARAVKRIRKARKVVRSSRKLGRTLQRFLKEARALDRFFGVVKGAASDAASSYAKWLKKDWKSITSKISTDLIATYATGPRQGAATVAAARINKEFIGTVVVKELGIEKPDPETIKVAIIFFMGRKRAVAASLARTFILQSLKYRTSVNLVFESIRAATPLTEADEIFKRTVVSTIAEVAQDTVQAIPFVAESGLLKYITEAIRKVVAKRFG